MLPLAAIERIARKAGVQRISSDAIRELERSVTDIALDLTIEIAEVARHAKRKTIKKEDITLASGKPKIYWHD
jgi:histone H3/H4